MVEHKSSKDVASKDIGAQRYVLRVGHSDDAGLGGEGWTVRMSDHFSLSESAQKWVKAQDYEALRQRFERACRRVTELESSAHETSGSLVEIGELVEIPDGVGGEPNTIFAEWNPERSKLPAGTKIYVMRAVEPTGDGSNNT